MNLGNSKKWIEAGKKLAINPNEQILCPECGNQILNIQDNDFGDDSTMIERLMYCQSCNAKNYIRMKKKE